VKVTAPRPVRDPLTAWLLLVAALTVALLAVAGVSASALPV